MTATTITPTQLALLRAALGLSHYVRKPTRNWLPGGEATKHPDDVAALERIGYLRTRMIAGPGGYEAHTEITAEGEAYAMAHLPPAAT
jgi:hypothetical protein